MAAYYNEFDKPTAAWLRELIKVGLIADGEVDERSIKDVDASDLDGFTQCHFFAGIGGWSYALRLAGLADDVPVWTGSCPCQPYSTAGKGLGDADERNLWPDFHWLIRECRPHVVFGEQVPNLEWADTVWGEMENIGYSFWPKVLRADCAGADHERRRLYWSATDTNGVRQPQSWKHRKDSGDHAARAFREADRLVDAFRRKSLPFLCRWHDGLSGRVGQVCCKGLGNAIVPKVAAEFIAAWMETQREQAGSPVA